MAIQKSIALRDAQNNQIEIVAGPSALLRGYTNSVPANCAAGDNGIQLFEIVLPADWLTQSANGVIAQLGAWAALGTFQGLARCFRIKNASTFATHLQGTITPTDYGGDMTLSDVNILTYKPITVTSFNCVASGA